MCGGEAVPCASAQGAGWDAGLGERLLNPASAAVPGDSGPASVAYTTVALAATCLGSGLLALPFAFASAGLGLGLLLLCLCAAWSVLASHLLCRCCDWSGEYSYERIAVAACGSAGALAMALSMVWLLLGAMAGLLVIVGDSLVFVAAGPAAAAAGGAGQPWWRSRPALLGLDVACVVLPLSSARSLHLLARSNVVALGCTLLVGSVLVERGFWHGDAAALREFPSASPAWDVLQALPIIMLSFGCQVQVPLMYRDLSRRSVLRMGGAVASAGAICSAIYGAVAIFGLMSLSSLGLDVPGLVPGNVLDGFPADDHGALAMRSAVAVSATMVYPLLCLPCRSAMLHLLLGRVQDVAGDSPQSAGSAGAWPWATHAAATLLIVGTTTYLAMLVPNLGKVLGVTGATSGAAVCYLLPPAFYLQLRRMQTKETQAATVKEAALCLTALCGALPLTLAAAWRACTA